MSRVAGVDGAPGGWAVAIMDSGKLEAKRVAVLSDLVDDIGGFSIVAIDIPIGLLDTYEFGGRLCDRAARKVLGKRASSVFPAPVRPALSAGTWPEACTRSRASAPNGKAISKQTFGILRKIEEVDNLLQSRPNLRSIVREIHPEVSFRELAGAPMGYSKKKRLGREERLAALRTVFPTLGSVI